MTRKIPQVGLDLLKDADFSLWEEDRVIPRDILLERVKGAEAVLSLFTNKKTPIAPIIRVKKVNVARKY